MDLSDKNLITYLIKHNYIEESDLKGLEGRSNEEIINTLIEKELLTRKLVLEAIAEENNVRFIDLEVSKPSNEDVLRLPEKFARRYNCVFVKETPKRFLLTTSKVEYLEDIKLKAKEVFKGKTIEVGYSDNNVVNEVLNIYKVSLEKKFQTIERKEYGVASEIFNEVLKEALDLEASDIHFEPQEESVDIRFRIDGVMHEVGSTSRDIFENLINRVKVLSNLRIDDHFSSQDGAIRVKTGDNGIDLRISIAPTINGQNVVIRILSRYIRTLSLNDLGLGEADHKILEEASSRPFGMILTVGPTGSGKTTTLYSVIKKLKDPKINITTIEDPVEYKIDGVNQIQVNLETEVTFARGLRSIVRQDPDVILVGEIRDRETSEIAINASLTGHLMLSTFHANDAATVIPRLLDMGVEPFLLASTLNLIIAQRLSRRICSTCRYSYETSFNELEKFFPDPKKYFNKDQLTLFKGKGCSACNNTGYKGRIGLFELIYITEDIKNVILKNPSSLEVRELATKNGARTMFDDGIEKVKEGLIDIDELIRVAPSEVDSRKIYGYQKEK